MGPAGPEREIREQRLRLARGQGERARLHAEVKSSQQPQAQTRHGPRASHTPIATERSRTSAARSRCIHAVVTRALHHPPHGSDAERLRWREAMRGLLALLFVVFVAVPVAAVADVVTEWNEIALATATAAKHGSSEASRTSALVHAAVFDAVNAVEARYTPYKVTVKAPPGASAEAAAVAAAHGALVRLYPDQKATLDQALAKALGRVGDGSAKTDGIAVGEKVAAEMVALRANDGAMALNTYRPVTTPGVYVMTVLPVSSQWGNVTPWVLERGSQFRPGLTPALTSGEWA